MKLVINGESRHFEQEEVQTIDRLMDTLQIEEVRGVAVAVNDAVVPRGRWSEYSPGAGDRVEIIRAVQGG